MKEEKEIKIRQYYKDLFSHGRVTKDNENAKKIIRNMFIVAVILLAVVIVLLNNTWLISAIKSESQLLYWFYVVVFVYAFLITFSFSLYHTISYFFELRHGHALNNADIRGLFKLCKVIYVGIHFPWIIIACAIKKLAVYLNIQDLLTYLSVLTLGYFFSLYICLTIVGAFLDLISQYNIPSIAFVTNQTYLYIAVFLSILICRRMPFFFLDKVLHQYKEDKKEKKYQKILCQYDLLKDYLLLGATFFLKALELAGDYKTLVDALFYSTNLFAMASTVRKKANEIGLDSETDDLPQTAPLSTDGNKNVVQCSETDVKSNTTGGQEKGMQDSVADGELEIVDRQKSEVQDSEADGESNDTDGQKSEVQDPEIDGKSDVKDGELREMQGSETGGELYATSGHQSEMKSSVNDDKLKAQTKKTISKDIMELETMKPNDEDGVQS